MRSDAPMPFRTALPWACFVAMLFLLNYMSRSTLTPLLVSVERDLGVGHAQATSLLLMQSLGFCITLAISGFLLSRIQPRYVASLPLAAAGCVLLCMPLVTSLDEARLVFVVFGLGVGLYFPAGMATLGSLVHPKDWGKTVAIHELAPNTGFILIPLLAQTALLFMDWRGVFACMGALMIVVGISFALWGRGGRTYAAPPSFGGCADLLKQPASWAVVLLLTISMIGEFSIFSILQLYLAHDAGFDPEQANLLLSLSRLPTPLVVIAGGIAADRLHAPRIIRICLVLHALALCLMALNSTSAQWLVLTGVVLQAASIAFLFPSIFKVFSDCFPAEQQPVLLSLSMPIAGVLSAGGIPFFLGFCGEYFSFGVGFVCIAVLSTLCVLCVAWLKTTKPA